MKDLRFVWSWLCVMDLKGSVGLALSRTIDTDLNFVTAFQLDVVLESNLSTIRVLEAIQKKLQRYDTVSAFPHLVNWLCLGP